MENRYQYPKRTYTKNNVSSMYIFFENGDFLEIAGSEIYDLQINTYDKLVREGRGVSPVAEKGYIKLKICDKASFFRKSYEVYNPDQIKKGRKSYMENRCMTESIIYKLWLFDSNNWHNVILGNIKAKMEDGFLIFEFLPLSLMSEASGEMHYINLGNITKDKVFKIDLDFENCESFVVYNSEIEEINIKCDNNLEWDGGDLCRSVESGYIKIKLDKSYASRENSLFDDENLKIKDFERRLCGNKGEACHDICHLYIDYYHSGYGTALSECVVVNDIISDEEYAKREQQAMEEEYTYYEYRSGYCKKLKDGSIIIAFGKNAEKTIKKF